MNISKAQLERLKPTARSGSKPRCHLLTHGEAAVVTKRLEFLLPRGVTLTADDVWMPQGFLDLAEAQLHKAPRLMKPEHMRSIRKWWAGATTGQNWDIASSCTISGRAGLLLVEAKAHVGELKEDGKPIASDHSTGTAQNHQRIGAAIAAASDTLNLHTGLPFKLSRDSHYQLANRFALACKLTELGIPVVLVYLGFVNATDMLRSHGRHKLFSSEEHWRQTMLEHSAGIIPAGAWDQQLRVNDQLFLPRLVATELPIAYLGPASGV